MIKHLLITFTILLFLFLPSYAINNILLGNIDSTSISPIHRTTYLYFPTSKTTAPAGIRVIKIRVSDMTKIDTFDFPGITSTAVNCMVIDKNINYAFLLTNTNPAKYMRLNLNDFLTGFTNTCTLNLQVNPSLFYDNSSSTLYAVIAYSFGQSKVIKVEIAGLTETAFTAPISFSNDEGGCAVNTNTKKAYCVNAATRIATIDLNTMTYILTISSGFSTAYTLSADFLNGKLYITDRSTPVKVIKVNIPTMTVDNTIILNAGDVYSYTSAIDLINGFLYIPIRRNPGRIYKINLSTFTIVGSLDMPVGDNQCHQLVIDNNSEYMYVSTGGSTRKIKKINLSTFSIVASYEHDAITDGEMYIGLNNMITD